MFKPDPKKQAKKRIVTYKCSDGTRVTQGQIDRRRSKAYEQMHDPSITQCAAYPFISWNDHDHTISQARCKQLGKTELIWDVQNIEFSSRLAHNEWESYGSGCFEEHANVLTRMLYLKRHDPERFEKRMHHISDYTLMKLLRDD